MTSSPRDADAESLAPGVARDGWLLGLCAALVLGSAAGVDVGGGDAGELGAAATVLGVAHPTGFAIDLLWLRLVSLLPMGTLALRQNLGTALVAAACLGVLASLVGTAAARLGITRRAALRTGALAAVCNLLGWQTFLASACAVEVYSLSLLAVLGAALLMLRGAGSRWLALLLGFSPGLHVTAGIYVLVLLAIGALVAWPSERESRALWVRGVLLMLGAGVIAYLPLASQRDPALDWGDPQSVSAIFAHLTASRIRSAFSAEMLGAEAAGASALFAQLAELSFVAAPALVAVLVGLRGQRVLVGSALLLVACDFGYGVWLHPMGIGARQVGHTAGALVCVLGGVGLAWLLERLFLRSCGGRVPGLYRALLWAAYAVVLLASLGSALGVRTAWADRGPELAELLGSGGMLERLPPRALLLCSSDDVCAQAMFALHAERVRPDVDVAPAQHLWDPTVLRQIEAEPMLALSATAMPVDGVRRALADERARRLIENPGRRPWVLEAGELARRVRARAPLAPLQGSAYLTSASSPYAGTEAASMRYLEQAWRARFGSAAPGAAPGAALMARARAASAWSRAYGEVGGLALGRNEIDLALRALLTAAQVAPERSAAWVNLGVGFERAGNDPAAIESIERALELDPRRASAWVNLVRLRLRRSELSEAQRALTRAAELGVRDARLGELARALERSRSR